MSKQEEDKMREAFDTAFGPVPVGPGTTKSLHQAFMENQDKAKAAPRGQFSATIRVVGGWTGTPVAKAKPGVRFVCAFCRKKRLARISNLVSNGAGGWVCRECLALKESV